jgi:hypothetical protein
MIRIGCSLPQTRRKAPTQGDVSVSDSLQMRPNGLNQEVSRSAGSLRLARGFPAKMGRDVGISLHLSLLSLLLPPGTALVSAPQAHSEAGVGGRRRRKLQEAAEVSLLNVAERFAPSGRSMSWNGA